MHARSTPPTPGHNTGTKQKKINNGYCVDLGIYPANECLQMLPGWSKTAPNQVHNKAAGTQQPYNVYCADSRVSNNAKEQKASIMLPQQ